MAKPVINYSRLTRWSRCSLLKLGFFILCGEQPNNKPITLIVIDPHGKVIVKSGMLWSWLGQSLYVAICQKTLIIKIYIIMIILKDHSCVWI
jgi:hypothetical protein